MSFFNEIRPFELLKLIRDGVVNHVDNFRGMPTTLLNLGTRGLSDALHQLGWIEISKEGEIRPTTQIMAVQRALRLSLTQLAPYGDSSVVAIPIFGHPKESPKSADVFVLMPFAENLRAVYDDHIKAVVGRLDIAVARADDFFAANSIISDVWSAINHARVLIADCTGRNPNVFYELGIAHTVGKPVILIAQSTDDIPFDIKHIRTILYELTPRGMRDFETALEETLTREMKRPRSLAEVLDWARNR